MVDPDMVRILGRSAFHDTALTSSGALAYLGGEVEPLLVDHQFSKIRKLIKRIHTSITSSRPDSVNCPFDQDVGIASFSL